MYNYDPKSLKAEEFINHEEIEETLKYAEENKHNAELIDSILEKAKLRKGLSHREAEVLLDCDIPEKNEDRRGNLSVVEEYNHVPFHIARAYWLYDVPGGESRGGALL